MSAIMSEVDSKISSELQKILAELKNNPEEVQYDLIDFLDSGKEISDAEFKKIMHVLANIDSKFDNFQITKHKLTQDQQEILLMVLSKKKGLDRLVLNGFNLTKTMIDQLSMSLSLRELRIYNIDQCSTTVEIQFGMLAQIPNLETLVLRYQGFEVATLCTGRNCAEQEAPTVKHHKSLITSQDILSIINTGNCLVALECPDAGFKQEDVAMLESALDKNKSLEYICLPNSLKINMHNISQFVTRNRRLKFPSDKIRTVKNKKGQNVMFWSPVVMSKIQELLRDSSGEHLKQGLASLGFDPNGYCYSGNENPILNSWIANEYHAEAARLIEEYASEIDPNQRDYDLKTALIIAAKAYSADKEFRALLKTNIKDLDAQDENGCTALHYLCAYGKTAEVQELLKRGANINIRNNQGRTPLDYANTLTESEVRAILTSMSMQPDRDAHALRDNLFEYLAFSIRGCQFERAGLSTSSSSHSGITIANLKNLKLLMEHIQSDDFLKENEQQIDRKKLFEKCETASKIFSGKSVIETCMENRKHLEHTLKSAGYLNLLNRENMFAVDPSSFENENLHSMEENNQEDDIEFSSLFSSVSSLPKTENFQDHDDITEEPESLAADTKSTRENNEILDKALEPPNMDKIKEIIRKENEDNEEIDMVQELEEDTARIAGNTSSELIHLNQLISATESEFKQLAAEREQAINLAQEERRQRQQSEYRWEQENTQLKEMLAALQSSNKEPVKKAETTDSAKAAVLETKRNAGAERNAEAEGNARQEALRLTEIRAAAEIQVRLLQAREAQTRDLQGSRVPQARDLQVARESQVREQPAGIAAAFVAPTVSSDPRDIFLKAMNWKKLN